MVEKIWNFDIIKIAKKGVVVRKDEKEYGKEEDH